MSGQRRVVIMHAGDPTMELTLAGIDAYRRTHPGWMIRQQYHQPKNAAETRELLTWQAEGWLTVGVTTVAVPPGVPWVSLRCGQAPWSIEFADDQIGACAAEHLAQLVPATVLMPVTTESHAEPWCAERMSGFRATLARLGIPLQSFPWRPHPGIATDELSLSARIMATPAPRALFATSDVLALDVVEQLIGAGIRVPADVAVLGADGLPRCMNFEVAISSVEVPHHAAGYAAAELLDLVMRGDAPAQGTRRLEPTGIIKRVSTDALTIQDPEVAAVVAAIAIHATGTFSVEDAVAASTLGRRSIEQRFRKALGCSILDEIHRARVTRACGMLADPRHAVSTIAHACGFLDAAHFTQVFRKVMGSTPSTWRKQRGAGEG